MRSIVTQVLEVVALEKPQDDDSLSLVVIAQSNGEYPRFSATFVADRGEIEIGDHVYFSITKED